MKKFLSLCLVVILMLVPGLVFASDTANGNIMEAGDIVSANGTANGLIMLAGKTVSSNANGDYAFIVGESIRINGNISRDAFIAGQNITVEEKGIINRDFYVAGSRVVINGVVNGKIYVLANELVIASDATVRGDIIARVNSITIMNAANVYGSVEYNSDAEASIPSGITTHVVEVEEREAYVPTIMDKFRSKVINILISLVMFVALVLIAPKMLANIDEKYVGKAIKEYHIGKTLGIGILALIVIPIISLFLMITVVGISVGIILFLLYAIVFMIAVVITAYVASIKIFEGKMNRYLAAIVTIVMIEVLKMIPIIGGWVYFLSVIFTFGLIFELMRKKETSSKDMTQEAIVEILDAPSSTENLEENQQDQHDNHDANHNANHDENHKE